MLTHKSLLEAYVYAKDKCCPALIHDIYQPNAVLSISTAASAVAFPPLVIGAEGIAQTLVTDFAGRFSDCCTYYVCEQIPEHGNSISYLPWLVIMREKDSAALRIGRGYYHWNLMRNTEQQWRVTEMHIRIDHMALVADGDAGLLHSLQSCLPYPWLAPAQLDANLKQAAARYPQLACLRDFGIDQFSSNVFSSAAVHGPQSVHERAA